MGETTQPTSDTLNPGGGAMPGDKSTPAKTEPAAAAAGAGGEGSEKGNVLYIPKSAMKRIKEEERQRGAKKASEELEAKAKLAGFDSVTAMLEYAVRFRAHGQPKTNPPAKTQPEQQPAAQRTEGAGNGTQPVRPQRGAPAREWRNYEKERERWKRETDEQRMEAQRLKRENRNLERRLRDQQVDQSLRNIALRAGVSPSKLSQSILLLREHVENMTQEQINAVDEEKFFTGLKETDPYLFGAQAETRRVVDTGVPGSGTPQRQPGATGTPAAVTPGKDKSKKSFQEMSPQEFKDHLASLGYDADMASPVSPQMPRN